MPVGNCPPPCPKQGLPNLSLSPPLSSHRSNHPPLLPNPSVVVQLDDSLAEEVAPGAGGAQGLRAQLLKMQQEKSAVDNQKAVDEAMMQAVVQAASAEIPEHYIVDMGRQEFSARIHTAVAKVWRLVLPILLPHIPASHSFCPAPVGGPSPGPSPQREGEPDT